MFGQIFASSGLPDVMNDLVGSRPRATMTDDEIQAAAHAAFALGAGHGGLSFTNEGGIATIDSAGKISWSGWGGIAIEGAHSQFGSGKEALAAIFGREDNANAPTTTPPDTPGPDDGQM